MASARTAERIATEGRLEDLVIRRTHGENLSVVMGDVLFKDLITCVQELVANSYDADAEHVDIKYGDGRDGLSITDDGTGMDLDGLRAFYGMGDSPKLNNPITAKGRRVIGKFGIASLVLRTLARHYILVTERDGLQYKVEETLSDDDKDTKPIRINQKKADGTRHGTRIFIDKLRFTEDERDIPVNVLMRRLSVEMPVIPDFAISLNSHEVKPKIIEKGTEYLVDIDDPRLGKVSGSIWYNQDIGQDDSGIYIKVHGKAVGGRNAELLGSRHSMDNSVFGVINADGLAGIVGFDRDNFIKDHPKIKKLREHILEVVRQISQDIRLGDQSARRKKAREIVKSLAPDIGKFVGQVIGSDTDYEIIFDGKDSDPISVLDKKEKKLHINPNHDYFDFGLRPKPSDISERLYGAARQAILREIVPDSKRDVLDRLEGSIQKTLEAERLEDIKAGGSKKIRLNDLVSDAETEEVAYRISPARLYEDSEISKLTGLGLPVWNRMVSSGVIGYNKSKFLGRDILGVMEKMKGHITLFEAVRRLWPKENAGAYHGLELDIMGKINLAKKRGLPQYVKDIAPHPPNFYIVRERDLDSFAYFLRTGEFPEGSNIFSQKYYHYRDLSTETRGTKGVIVYVADVISEDLEVVREAVVRELDFIRDNSRMPVGVRTASYFSDYNSKRYVVGILAGKVKDFEEGFTERGFARHDITGKAPSVLYIGVSSQKNLSLPLTKVKSFNDPVVEILKQISK